MGPGNDDPGAGQPTAIVTLVAGTWARKAAWTRPDSPLCRALTRAGSVERRLQLLELLFAADECPPVHGILTRSYRSRCSRRRGGIYRLRSRGDPA